MAHVDGRNPVFSWIIGVLCAGIIAGLIWIAVPIVPTMAAFVGETLRSVMP